MCAIVLRSTVSSQAAEMYARQERVFHKLARHKPISNVADRCGSGDTADFAAPRDGCVIALMYLEEYCGTVYTCMFTARSSRQMSNLWVIVP